MGSGGTAHTKTVKFKKGKGSGAGLHSSYASWCMHTCTHGFGGKIWSEHARVAINRVMSKVFRVQGGHATASEVVPSWRTHLWMGIQSTANTGEIYIYQSDYMTKRGVTVSSIKNFNLHNSIPNFIMNGRRQE